jgi:flagellar biosynthetic protein FliR
VTASVLPFDPLAPGSATTLALFAARMSGLLLIAPVFSATSVPRMVRVGTLVVLTVLLQPVALASVTGTPRLTPATAVSELLIGFAIGLGAALIVGAAEAAGDVMAVQIGLSGSAILDPLDTSSIPVLGSFTRMMALVILLSLDLHHGMLTALAESTVALPVGTVINATGGLQAMLQTASALFVIGVRFAAPVIAVVLIVNVALALLGRAAPQLNILSVSFPIQITVGLLALSATLPAMGRYLTSWRSVTDGMLTHIVHGFTAVGAH